ncbi:MAG: DUF2914 domain-containing protein [Gammaproteobacteria bacterium]|nr:DUF2914 domain-containing protein [Gammaproteobacteria bacterium]MDH3767593.1 DUF2914 domain-containing protein [Gammaproteobacteria bacterium]
MIDEGGTPVLPNGVKTWTCVYDDNEKQHWKTLGIYPEMSVDDAKKSVAAGKAANSRVASQDPEFVIRDGRIESANPSSSQIPVLAGAAVSLIVVSALGWLFLRGDPAPEMAAAAAQLDESVQRPADNLPSPFKDDNELDAQPVDAVTLPETQAIADRAADKVVTQVAETPKPAVPATVEAPKVPEPRTQNLPPERPPTRSGAQPVSTGVDPGLSSVGSRVSDVPEGLVLDGRVARGNLATAVSQREPVDDLGSFILGNGADEQKYYFFTELRDLAGQRVRHRWLYNKRVVAEVPFKVGEAWSWRVYSSKTFIPTMSGSWHAQVLLDDDTVIYSLPFTFNP